MPRRVLTPEEAAFTKLHLRRWVAEMGQVRVGQRLGVGQQTVSQALARELPPPDMLERVKAEIGARRRASASIAMLPEWIDIDRLPSGLRAALEDDAFPESTRSSVPALVGIDYAKHAEAPIEWWLAEARRIAESGPPRNRAPLLHAAEPVIERPVQAAPRAELATWEDFVDHFGPQVGMESNEIAEAKTDAAATGWRGLTGDLAKDYLRERRDTRRHLRGEPTKVRQRAAANEPLGDGKSEREKALEEAARRADERKRRSSKSGAKKKPLAP